MSKICIILLLSVYACATAQRITTIHLDGVQYFISRMNPYSPELNYFLAYQYCRSLGLQLASFETKEKADSMTTYLKNAGYGNYDFWTSGNRLGTGMFLWMSTGLPFNATFDFFENSTDAHLILDPVDHNSNTAPQRTARDSTSGADKACVMLKQPSLKWMPEDCSVIKDFICEQTRCYYYNYGSIPVSSAQGRPIKSTTAAMPETADIINIFTTTPQPLSRIADLLTKKPYNQLKLQTSEPMALASNDHQIEESQEYMDPDTSESSGFHHHETSSHISGTNRNLNDDEARDLNDDLDTFVLTPDELTAKIMPTMQQLQYNTNTNSNKLDSSEETKKVEDMDNSEAHTEQPYVDTQSNEEQHVFADSNASNLSGVDVRVKQISELTKKHENSLSGGGLATFHNNNNHDDVSRQSFLSLTDLIRTLRPNDKQIIPQIDSDYSNAMRVLGENMAATSTTEHK